jgi:hypothetical protein
MNKRISFGGDAMTEEPPVQKSLIEQILDEMFSKIEGVEEFDERTTQQLKQLASSGDFDKIEEIKKVIRPNDREG